MVSAIAEANARRVAELLGPRDHPFCGHNTSFMRRVNEVLLGVELELSLAGGHQTVGKFVALQMAPETDIVWLTGPGGRFGLAADDIEQVRFTGLE